MPTPYMPAGGRAALARHLLAQELVRNLDQDAGAVAEQRIVAGGAAMLEVLQDLQALLDDGMAFRFLMLTTKPTPQASRSLAGS
jgi:hypothetical protein